MLCSGFANSVVGLSLMICDHDSFFAMRFDYKHLIDLIENVKLLVFNHQLKLLVEALENVI